MRPSILKETVDKSRLQREVPGALQLLGRLFVAHTRCSNLRCRREGLGFRKPDDWVQWAKVKCPRCGCRRQVVRSEKLCEVEVNAPVKVARFRALDFDPKKPSTVALEDLPPAEGAVWEYAPFEFGLEATIRGEKTAVLVEKKGT